MGMWELFRVHDVFEAGTKLDTAGRPTATSRKLPDGEIAAGTPIPAVVPIPTIAMPVMPTASFQGFPFYIPAQAGHRPPTPPLDVIDDGGLARHIIIGGTAVHHKEHLPAFSLAKARLDFDKSLETAQAVFIPEGGATELNAMNFHAVRTHASFTPEGVAANFITNGRPKVAGAPLADPCVSDTGTAMACRVSTKAPTSNSTLSSTRLPGTSAIAYFSFVGRRKTHSRWHKGAGATLLPRQYQLIASRSITPISFRVFTSRTTFKCVRRRHDGPAHSPREV